MEALKFKKTILFVFGLSLFLLSGQNPSLLAQAVWQPSLIQKWEENWPSPAPYPVNDTHQPPPFLTAQSVLILDRDSAVVLFQKNAAARLLPASTVKIMTALVALDHYSLEEVLTVSDINWEGQDVGLQEGERITVRALLHALLVASGNDAAQVLAKNFPGGEKAFVAAMNQKAREFNLEDTSYANPTGLDSDDFGQLLPDQSRTTTLDLARLTIQALRNPVFAQVVVVPRMVVTDVTGQIVHFLENINQLLGEVRGLKGVKTGWTQQAGECLVSYIEREGKGIIVVVLGSQDRFGETEKLVKWVFANHSWEILKPPTQY
jgi:D-alanyl-D-alanine carboxypeptidase (penicillin-binding protein 5/6)